MILVVLHEEQIKLKGLHHPTRSQSPNNISAKQNLKFDAIAPKHPVILDDKHWIRYVTLLKLLIHF